MDISNAIEVLVKVGINALRGSILGTDFEMIVLIIIGDINEIIVVVSGFCHKDGQGFIVVVIHHITRGAISSVQIHGAASGAGCVGIDSGSFQLDAHGISNPIITEDVRATLVGVQVTIAEICGSHIINPVYLYGISGAIGPDHVDHCSHIIPDRIVVIVQPSAGYHINRFPVLVHSLVGVEETIFRIEGSTVGVSKDVAVLFVSRNHPVDVNNSQSLITVGVSVHATHSVILSNRFTLTTVVNIRNSSVASQHTIGCSITDMASFIVESNKVGGNVIGISAGFCNTALPNIGLHGIGIGGNDVIGVSVIDRVNGNELVVVVHAILHHGANFTLPPGGVLINDLGFHGVVHSQILDIPLISIGTGLVLVIGTRP